MFITYRRRETKSSDPISCSLRPNSTTKQSYRNPKISMAADASTLHHAGLPLATPLPEVPALDTAAVLGQPAPLVDAPPLDAPMSSDAVIEALERLYAVYKVEHWACLEELRAVHGEFAASGGRALADDAAANADAVGPSGGADDGNAAATAAAAAAAAAAGTFRELMHVLKPCAAAAAAAAAAAPVANGDAMDVDAPSAQQQQQQQQQDKQRSATTSGSGRRYGDATCGYGSDGEPAEFSDAEDAVLGAPHGRLGRAAAAAAAAAATAAAASASGGGRLAPPPSAEQLEAWRARFAGSLGGVAALERAASAASALFMDAQGALACLCGRSGRYLVRRAAATIGRSTDAKGDADVDLTREPGAGKVSRAQAQLLLGADGVFTLTNVGRRVVFVNGQPLARGESAPLPHLALFEAGGARLLFLVNALAVRRAVARVGQLVM